ncbi:MAG: STAS domain-containing protein [Roseiflexaceae bacterium]
MTTLPIASDEEYIQQARLQQFFLWTAISSFCFILLYGVLFVVFNDMLAGLMSVVGFSFGCVLLLARRMVYHGQVVRSVLLCSGGLLIAALIFVVAQPSLYPILDLVPLLALAVALPYIPRSAVLRLAIACWLTVVVITLLGLFIDFQGAPRPAYMNLLLSGMIAATAALILLLLWQFSSRLNDTLATVRGSREALAASNQALAENNLQLETKVIEQDKLLELVSTLEVPVIDLSDGILLAPIVGHIDSRRATVLTARLLNDADQHRARLVIIDITGVPLMDTMVAQLLVETTAALRLLGCKIALCGISAQVATTLTTLGISLSDVTTVRGPQEAIALNRGDRLGDMQRPLTW